MLDILKKFSLIFIFYVIILILLRQALIIARGVEFAPITLETLYNYIISYDGFHYTISFVNNFKDTISNFNVIISGFNSFSDIINIVKYGFIALFNIIEIILSFTYVIIYTIMYVLNFVPYILGYNWAYYILG